MFSQFQTSNSSILKQKKIKTKFLSHKANLIQHLQHLKSKDHHLKSNHHHLKSYQHQLKSNKPQLSQHLAQLEGEDAGEEELWRHQPQPEEAERKLLRVRTLEELVLHEHQLVTLSTGMATRKMTSLIPRCAFKDEARLNEIDLLPIYEVLTCQ